LDVRVTPVTMSDLPGLRFPGDQPWPQRNPFVTPAWLTAWWTYFGRNHRPLILRVDVRGRMAGVAPLMVQNGTARFMGSEDLCDHGDFPSNPFHREVFFSALLRHLKDMGVHRLMLASVRPDSAVLRWIVPAAHAAGCRVSVLPKGVSMEMGLPASWEAYLGALEGKQRHEVRRKLRRASEAGRMTLRTVQHAAEASAGMDGFLRLFRRSRPDKRRFLTPEREAFFRALADELSRAGMLRLNLIEIDNRPAAATFCVHLGNTTYLYNSGFDPVFRNISIGIVSKLMSIRESIENGFEVYDFLNGTERYKYRLGGKEVSLSSCVVEW
jgi:CelD/BcsL family acetyltransferase involved in cellulose biosynthesis